MEDPMRVIVNRFCTAGQRTGIGHYTAELLRCMQEQAPGQVECFPTGLAWRLSQLWGRTRPAISRGERGPADASGGGVFGFVKSLRRNTLGWLRGLGQAYLSRQMRKALAA